MEKRKGEKKERKICTRICETAIIEIGTVYAMSVSVSPLL